MIPSIDVFADVTCPFAHVGLRRLVARRTELGRRQPVIRVRAWPLEYVNGCALEGAALLPKVAALRASVAPDLFTAFDAGAFPASSLPALASEAAAYREDPEVGEAFSLAVRAALFEHGLDVSDPEVLEGLRRDFHVPDPSQLDEEQVNLDYDEGLRRGVVGSPHFFTPDGADFFCPSLEITHDDGRLHVSFDERGFAAFADAVFG